MEWLELISLSAAFASVIIRELYSQFSIPDEKLKGRIDDYFEEGLRKTDTRILESARDSCSRVKVNRHSILSEIIV